MSILQMGAQALGTWLGEQNRAKYDNMARGNAKELEDLYKDPELLRSLVADKQGPSAYDSISTDPALRNKQMASLGALDDVVNSGGLRMSDKSQLNDIQQSNAAREQGSRQAISQNMQARGMGGSGMELAQQLAAQQGGADRNAQSSMQIAGNAQDRALQAMISSGQMAGGIRNQDWSQAAEKARANDDINRFNTGTANQFQLANRQNQYDAKAGQAAGIGSQMNLNSAQAGHQQNLWNGIGQAASQGIGQMQNAAMGAFTGGAGGAAGAAGGAGGAQDWMKMFGGGQ
jgi:hypothetical protein